jgi:hypothetical protein
VKTALGRGPVIPSALDPAHDPAKGSAPHPIAATRSRTPGWRDPRLWVGLAIVAVSVVAGVRVVGSADDSVPVWALRDDLEVGATIEQELLEVRAVRFGDAGDLSRYVRADQPLPADRTLTRAIGAGELLPVAALGPTGGSGVVQAPIRVPAEGIPPSVEVGSRVDVYASDESEADRPARLLVADVVVTAAPVAAESFGSTGERQLVLGLPEDEEATLARLVAASNAGSLTVVGRG